MPADPRCTSVLFVGGPWHGRRLSLDEGPHGLSLTFCVPVPQPMKISIVMDPVEFRVPGPAVYRLRHYVGPGKSGTERQAAYVNDDTSLWGQGFAGDPVDPHDLALADHLLAALAEDALPVCVVPGCERKAPWMFIADEMGRLAGRLWSYGDKIRLCQPHGIDIYRAQGVYGREHLPEWLRADAVLDPMDVWDAGHGDQEWIVESRSRAMRVHGDKP